jgi:hypothetical protein
MPGQCITVLGLEAITTKSGLSPAINFEPDWLAWPFS